MKIKINDIEVSTPIEFYGDPVDLAWLGDRLKFYADHLHFEGEAARLVIYTDDESLTLRETLKRQREDAVIKWADQIKARRMGVKP